LESEEEMIYFSGALRLHNRPAYFFLCLPKLSEFGNFSFRPTFSFVEFWCGRLEVHNFIDLSEFPPFPTAGKVELGRQCAVVAGNFVIRQGIPNELMNKLSHFPLLPNFSENNF